MQHSLIIRHIAFSTILFWGTAAFGGDTVVHNRSGTRALSDDGLLNAKPFVNPLPPPDTSKVKAETSQGAAEPAPGFMPGSPGGRARPRRKEPMGLLESLTHPPVSCLVARTRHWRPVKAT